MYNCLLRALIALTALSLPAVTPATEPVSAQSQACRCVDADGNEIERCTCWVQPRFNLTQALPYPFDDRPRLGVYLVNAPEGARISFVQPDSPADEVGLDEGDIIISIAGRSITTRFDEDDPGGAVERLRRMALEWEEGDDVTVTYLRDGEEITATAKVAVSSPEWSYALEGPYVDLPGWGATVWARAAADSARRMTEEARRATERLGAITRARGALGTTELTTVLRALGTVQGLELMEMREGLSDYFGTAEGVLVLEAENESLGLQDGDVILRIGDREATDPNRVRRILRSYDEDEEVSMTIFRDGREMRITGRLGSD